MSEIKHSHLAGIIPVAGLPLDFNMPWNDALMPVNQDYLALERAVHTAALAGCNTIWIITYRETQPLIRKKLGEWIHDPETIWKGSNVYFNKVEIPIYYVSISPKDRERRDSLAWSVLYGAKVAAYVSSKISKWVKPRKFLAISPYGVIDDDIIKSSRDLFRQDQNIYFSYENKSVLDNEHLPFSFSEKEYDSCQRLFKQNYTGDEREKTFADIFSPLDLNSFLKKDANWFYNISSWNGYANFIGSEHNKLCQRPKHMVLHKWWGFVKDK